MFLFYVPPESLDFFKSRPDLHHQGAFISSIPACNIMAAQKFQSLQFSPSLKMSISNYLKN